MLERSCVMLAEVPTQYLQSKHVKKVKHPLQKKAKKNNVGLIWSWRRKSDIPTLPFLNQSTLFRRDYEMCEFMHAHHRASARWAFVVKKYVKKKAC